MENLIKNFTNDFEHLINKFCDELSEKFSLDKDDVSEVWKDLSGVKATASKATASKTTASKPSTSKTTSSKTTASKTSSKPSSPDKSTCPYVFSKGDKSGSVCGSSSKSGATYCSKHSKFEGIGQEQKPTKKVVPSASKAKKDESLVPIVSGPVLKLNKNLNKFWHSVSGMVFKSKDDKVVIGKCVDDKLVPLSSEDFETCKKYRFKYDQNSDNESEQEQDQDLDSKELINAVTKAIMGEDSDDPEVFIKMLKESDEE